ncbi:hypothetical protein EB169_08055 [archaeon]|nr:hypothetical protein [archaeon]NDB55763.1 hypothetical protein [archaeon]
MSLPKIKYMSKFLSYLEVYPNLDILNQNYDLIYQEYKNNLNELEFRDFTAQQERFIDNRGEGYPIGYSSYFSAEKRDQTKYGWHLAPLFAERTEVDFNTRVLPTLTKVLLQVGLTDACAINALDPGQSLDWHVDKDYIPGVQLLRIIWGLDIDPNDSKDSFIQIVDESGNIETQKFENKKFYIFHPMSKHRVENNMSSCRSVLCIDYITDTEYTQNFL